MRSLISNKSAVEAGGARCACCRIHNASGMALNSGFSLQPPEELQELLPVCSSSGEQKPPVETSGPALRFHLHRSVHGHIAAHMLLCEPDMSRMCGSGFSSSALSCLCLRMDFPAAGVLWGCSPMLLSVCSALSTGKHPSSFFPSASVFLCPQQLQILNSLLINPP